MADAETLETGITALTNDIALIQVPARSTPVIDSLSNINLSTLQLVQETKASPPLSKMKTYGMAV